MVEKPLIQAHTMVQVMGLENLRKILDEITSTCHKYWIEKVTERFVYVGYNNPDEYGTDDTTIAVYPCYYWDNINIPHNRLIINHIHRMINDPDDVNWQAFDCIWDYEAYWNPTSEDWEIKTKKQWDEIKKKKGE